MTEDEYIKARWEAMSEEGRRILGLDTDVQAREFLFMMWRKQYFEQQALKSEAKTPSEL